MQTIKEDLIHYIWRTKKFDLTNLRTKEGQALEILSFGTHNQDAGPDFLDARLEIDGVLWAGHIEIHLRASDWIKHRHSNDPQYQNVILHVVLEADTSIMLTDGTFIPSLELGERIDERIIAQYHYLQNNQSWIPCEDMIGAVDELIKQQTKDRHLVHRLTDAASGLLHDLVQLSGDWSGLVYQRIAWAFGLKVNASAMKLLTQSVPYSIVRNHLAELHEIEALLFGQSGILPLSHDDEYITDLCATYEGLKMRYEIQPLNRVVWKFSQMRPPGFPTIRIAQFCQWLNQNKNFPDRFFSLDTKEITSSFNIQLSGFWETHYRFGVPSKKSPKSLGKPSRDIILINAIAPLFFAKGIFDNKNKTKEKAITLLESVGSERNRITKRWTSLGMTNNTAADSQSLLHLKQFSCDRHQCISCPIGHKIMSHSL